jgi:hypothetical protein
VSLFFTLALMQARNGTDGEFPAGPNRSVLVEWKTTASLTMPLPDDMPRVPSFFSTLASRRYAFDLQIVVGTKRGISQKPLRLRIPVQIVHTPVEKNPDGLSVDFEDDLQAPVYVP